MGRWRGSAASGVVHSSLVRSAGNTAKNGKLAPTESALPANCAHARNQETGQRPVIPQPSPTGWVPPPQDHAPQRGAITGGRRPPCGDAKTPTRSWERRRQPRGFGLHPEIRALREIRGSNRETGQRPVIPQPSPTGWVRPPQGHAPQRGAITGGRRPRFGDAETPTRSLERRCLSRAAFVRCLTPGDLMARRCAGTAPRVGVAPCSPTPNGNESSSAKKQG